ncbi:MAG: alpha-amylase family glycosyl hydrolase [Tetrasphaera jenkinsii]|uniref:Putative Alpha-amylase n=1 Tax=Nostocoides jenkinsii Ben 74 TaxID=1193518 RepID=A0A077M6X8_9MICO|nr:alpha-amylase family glycosyl hydrolase [Tetrasphaera jenkinsii]MCI1261354.1 alpha-amylase family glycosyl hydrolase [Tetrasphaera jenkinsii]CCI52324.1 putative Alpha-amylase [Tetrasphaera jenkinsii Ben 74]
MTDRYLPAPGVEITHPEWSRSATIYQINTRQFTAEGTLAAAAQQLPRVRDLGVDIVWLMPINPIGEVNRKGSLGSPYAVRDYLAVNPELGTLEDLKSFVAQAHELGLKVILDWVANHTAWDNHLVTDHPEWYARDWKGEFTPTPWWDWDDIIDLDYDVPEMRRYMTEAMCYWVREADIDGYRCDVAGLVPVDFWDNVRRELDEIKPVFMLAEWEARDLHVRAFDMTYAWTWNDTMHHIAQGKATVEALYGFYAWNAKGYPRDAIRMMFVSNHDKNSWDGTEYEMFGDAVHAAIVLSVVGEGMPLLYNGQEAGNEKRLKFFEKDPIEWREHPMADFYRSLFALKHATSALWNGAWGARMVNVRNSAFREVLSFVRADDQSRIFCVLNLSGAEQTITFDNGPHLGAWREHFTQESVELGADSSMTIEPWGYRVFLGA